MMTIEPGDPDYVAKDFTKEDLIAEDFVIVDSSAFQAARWEECQAKPCNPYKPCDGHIQVVFHRGKKTPDVPGARWEYYGVPRGTFDEMVGAQLPDSPGKFFARMIKGQKRAFKLEPKQ